MRHTAETKAKLSEMRSGAANPFYGRSHTEEFKKAQSLRTRTFNATRQYDASPQSIVTPLDPAILGYLAGMIDADGSIRFRKETRPFVCVYNTFEPLLLWLKETLKHGSIYKTTKGREQVQCWQITAARDVFSLLTAIRPFLIVKAADADAVLNHIKDKYEWARTAQ